MRSGRTQVTRLRETEIVRDRERGEETETEREVEIGRRWRDIIERGRWELGKREKRGKRGRHRER